MTDLRVRYGFILALALFPILLFSIYMAFVDGRILLVIISILAWAIAFFSLWVTTDQLVFSHLRKIKSASDAFSDGSIDARVGPMPKAPIRISELGEAFDSMADNIAEREMRLLDNLDEKEMLLREIHHRVKNNLQIIISLLNMQERKLDDPRSLEAIQETRGRINAIALVHRGLYEGEDLRVINMQLFLNRLVDELKVGLGAEDQNVEICVNVEAINFEPDTAIPTALFIVEALTNAMKHGVPKGGKIDISIIQKLDKINVSVSDNGLGKAKDSSTGTGYKLMRGFARQLSGEWVEDDVSKGYKTSLTFTT